MHFRHDQCGLTCNRKHSQPIEKFYFKGMHRFCSSSCRDFLNSATDCNLLICSCSSFPIGAGIIVLENQVFAIGGYDGSQHLSSVECYSACSNQWMSIASMQSNRCYVGTAVMSGKLFATGGYDGLSLLDSAERYDPLLQEWTSISSMATSRCDMGVAVLVSE